MTSDKKTEPRMQTSTFVPLYLAAVEQDMTRQDFAESIGVQTSTVYQRIKDMHDKGACKKTFPQLRARGKRSFKETVEAAVAAYRNGSASPKADLAVDAAKVTVKPAAKATKVEAASGEYDPAAELDKLLNG
jgi:hypothetical protein